MRYSPLRYPGGKGKISSFFSELFVANNLIGGTYIEPYVELKHEKNNSSFNKEKFKKTKLMPNYYL